jgi:hypothetical protein
MREMLGYIPGSDPEKALRPSANVLKQKAISFVQFVKVFSTSYLTT